MSTRALRARTVVVLALTFSLLACTGGAGDPSGTGGAGAGGTGAGGDDGAGTGTGAGNGTGGGTGAGGGTATASIPDIFYGEWAYMHATLYEEGEEPRVSDVPGTAVFERDDTYTQDYSIGGIGNHYAGRYEIDATRLKTYDDQGELAFDFRWTIGDDPTVGAPVLTLTIEDEQGRPSVVYALEAANRD